MGEKVKVEVKIDNQDCVCYIGNDNYYFSMGTEHSHLGAERAAAGKLASVTPKPVRDKLLFGCEVVATYEVEV